jgi:hypothetical protein
MIVQLTDSGTVELLDGSDFGGLRISAPDGSDVGRILEAANAGAIDGTGHAQIPVEWLRMAARSQGLADAGWEQGFQAMLEFATSRGWMRPGSPTVQVHIERR